MDGRVLDSWAILAWMRAEVCAGRVRILLDRAEAGELVLRCSAINAGEVFYQLVRAGRQGEAARFWSGLLRSDSRVRLEAVTTRRVKSAAQIKARYPLAYADAFAIALAREFGSTLVTGDTEMRAPERDGLVIVEWLPTS
ncbi:MAG TPA: type II toxin-antitoxin system VapC family toxin [Chloroflexota bacterium]|nr:type II toxin-antitoxin system VapC family toxin [Chloroflexota bacterium]